MEKTGTKTSVGTNDKVEEKKGNSRKQTSERRV